MTSSEEKRLAYLDAMGIQAWSLRGVRGAVTAVDTPGIAVQSSEALPAAADCATPAGDIAGLDWEALRLRVSTCTRCALHEQRIQAVFGAGNRTAQWLIVGEAPGADEDRQGEPFVGRAGKLLDNMLLAIGLRREEVYIANIVKCRPPNNREPAPEEAQTCAPYLARQIALIKPKIILAVGRIAAQNLLESDRPVGTLRGKRFYYDGTEIPVVVTYHPAYLLRSPHEKRKAWQDLLFAKETLSSL